MLFFYNSNIAWQCKVIIHQSIIPLIKHKIYQVNIILSEKIQRFEDLGEIRTSNLSKKKGFLVIFIIFCVHILFE